MSEPLYELYAIRYGTFAARRRADNFIGGDPRDEPMPLDYFIWAIKGPERAWVVDTGFVPAMAARRKRQIFAPPTSWLGAIGIDPAQVEDVILTHVHWDHAGGQDLFAKAQFHVQTQELAYVSGPCMCDPDLAGGFEPGDITGLIEKLFARRLVFHDGDAILAPGLSVHRVGGHTAGMMVVRARTRRGHMVLASDAAHFYENFRSGRPFPIFCDLRAVHAGYRRMRILADDEALVIPGHDPEVMARHAPLRPDLAQHVVRLD